MTNTELAEKLVAHWAADILSLKAAGYAISKDGANIIATSPDGKAVSWQDFGGKLSQALPGDVWAVNAKGGAK